MAEHQFRTLEMLVQSQSTALMDTIKWFKDRAVELEILESLLRKLEPTKFKLDPTLGPQLYDNFSCAYTRRQIWVEGDKIVVNLFGPLTDGWKFSLADPDYENKIRALVKDRLGANG